MAWIKSLLPRWARRPAAETPSKGLTFQEPISAIAAGRLGSASSDFPRFHSTAGDQLDPRRSDRFDGIRLKLRNAYTPSQPVTDRRMFAGRTEVLTTLIRSIEDQRLHTVLYGERGIGKTSLLHVLTQAARDARYLVVYLSCGANSNFDELFRTVAAAIPVLFHSGFGPTAEESERGATLADLLPASEISARVASDMLSRVIGTRVLVVLDEFDRCDSAEFRRNVAELLKNLSDRSVRVQLVIAGVAANLTELVEHIPSIQRNVFALEVPKMTPLEIRHLVQNGERSSGLRFDQAASDQLVALANGMPYLASLLSHHAGLAAIDAGRLQVTAHDVSIALSEALDELKGRISKRAQSQIAAGAINGMHKVLEALAGAIQATGGTFQVSEIVALYPGAAEFARCKSLVELLAADGVLMTSYEEEGEVHYRFLEEGVPAYLWLLAGYTRYSGNEGVPVAPVSPSKEAVSP